MTFAFTPSAASFSAAASDSATHRPVAMIATSAVSYTHLDVYKRQAQRCNHTHKIRRTACTCIPARSFRNDMLLSLIHI